MQSVVDAVPDLYRQPLFLHLKPARESLHDAGYLAQPRDLAVGNVRHVTLPRKNGIMWCSQVE